MITTTRTLRGAAPNHGGYRQLEAAPGEAHQPPLDLDGAEVLATLAHLSDIHVCDAQSPARVEFLDRWCDPDSPLRAVVGEIGSYRAQELLTAQVATAMVQAVNAVERGPVGRRPLDLAVVTGDSADNAQANEIDWYLTLLDGGRLVPDSGNPQRWQGVADLDEFDERYWHPDGPPFDLPRAQYGFPAAPGLLDAIRAPIDTPGLRLPWLAVHGNHDRLLQGNAPAVGLLAAASIGGSKPTGLPDGLSTDEVLTLLQQLGASDPAAFAAVARSPRRAVAADERRRIVTVAEFLAAHDRHGARPPRHGFGPAGHAYYRHDLGPLTLLTLDTVNPYGGYQGSLDREQFAWLTRELSAADDERRYVALASHHRLEDLVNPAAPDETHRRVLHDELQAELDAHPSVVLWLNGHSHLTAVTAHGSWWEVTAPSFIDWPQQARIVEVLRRDGELVIATTMVDHVGEAPWSGSIETVPALAGLSRELAANHWQYREQPFDGQISAGTPSERNALLALKDPFS